MNRWHRHAAIALAGPWLTLAAAGAPQATGRQSNPVYVDDSPRAWELFRLAQDQAAENTGEAARLFQELLDDYGSRLAPLSDASPDHFVSMRARVLAALRADEDLLSRYRVIQTAEAQRLLESDRLDEVAATRSMTEPGLEALLRMAQRELEAGRFRRARRWLEEARAHPDFTGRRAVHGWLMWGLASHFVSDEAQRQAAINALEALGRPAAAAVGQLQALLQTPEPPAPARGITSLDQGRASDLSDLVPEAIWSYPLADSLFNRRTADPQSRFVPQNAAFQMRRRDGRYLTASATVAGNVVYLNEGQTIVALDRFTGHEIWPVPYRHRSALALAGREVEQSQDLNIVAVHDDWLVTLTGHAAEEGRSGDGNVLCLDARTGRRRWVRSLDRIGGVVDHEGLFPHGAPIIADDLVIVLARKINDQMLGSCYVVALDLADGSLRWIRHIASSGGLRKSGRPLGTLVHDRGDLYVSTTLGAIARLDAQTGWYHWVHRFSVPIRPTHTGTVLQPWEIAGPVPQADQVIALQPDRRRVVVLDRETGQLLRSHDAGTRAGWAAPRYLLADDTTVYAVGREIRAFHLEAPDVPVWSLPPPAQSDVDGWDRDFGAFEIAGRVQLLDGSLVVPTQTGVLIVDAATGSVTRRLPMDIAGNPLAMDSQLILAGADRLDAYMSFRRAEQMLRSRIVAAPDDPEPALSLLRLGIRVRETALVLEAADLVLAAMDPPPVSGAAHTRRDLFQMLLEAATGMIAASAEEAEQLFATLEVVAIEPDQRVEFLLARGDWLCTRSLARAIESYQTILASEGLPEVWRSEEGVARAAATWATARIAALIEEHGPAVYAPLEDAARRRLNAWREQSEPAVGPLVDLIGRFPLSTAATEAARTAARAASAERDWHTALQVLLLAYRLHPNRAAAEGLLGHATGIALQAGWTDLATSILRHATATHGQIVLAADEGPRPAGPWLATLESSQRRAPLPRIGPAREIMEALPGRVIRPHPASRPLRAPTDRIVLLEGSDLHLLRGPELEPFWTRRIEEAQDAQLLCFDDRGLLLWFPSSRTDPMALMIDPATGVIRWNTPPMGDLLGDPVEALAREREIEIRMPDGEPFVPGQTIPLLGEDQLVLVRRTGTVLALDLSDGTTMRWSTGPLLEQVHLARLTDHSLILAGLQRALDERAGDGDLQPVVLVVDPLTGHVRHRVRPIGSGGLRWMQIGPLATLVFGTDEGIEAVNLMSGTRLWADITYDASGSRAAWAFGRHVVISDHDQELRALAVDDGSLSDPFEPPLRGDWDPHQFRNVVVDDERLYALYAQRVVRFSAAGSLLGADVIGEDRDYLWMRPAADRLILVSGLKPRQLQFGDDGRRRTQYVYRVYALSENCKVLGEAVQLPMLERPIRSAAMLDGWLLLSTKDLTYAIRMPAGDT